LIGVLLILLVTALFVVCRTKQKFKKEKAALFYGEINDRIKRYNSGELESIDHLVLDKKS
jgi:hypothetical protein